MQKGERPDRIKLNVNIEGSGTVWIKDVSLSIATMKKSPGDRSTHETVVGEAGKLPEGTIDLLARIDAARDHVYHHWQQDNKGWTKRDEILETPRGPFGVLEVPYYLPEEYELVADVERTEGDGLLGLLLVSGDARFNVEFDNFPALGWLTGFGRLDGHEVKEVDAKEVHTGQLLPLEARRTITITVRKSAVNVECGGKKVIEYHGSLDRLSVAGWPTRNPTFLQIQSYNGVFRIHKLTVRPLCKAAALPTHFVDEPFNGHDLTGWLEYKRDGLKAGRWQVGTASWTAQKPDVIQWSEGSGALVSVTDKEHGSELITRQRWGDCHISLEFLLPKGATTAIRACGLWAATKWNWSIASRRARPNHCTATVEPSFPRASGAIPSHPRFPPKSLLASGNRWRSSFSPPDSTPPEKRSATRASRASS